MHLLIGGRHFSAAGDPPVVFTASIDGTPIETWTVEPGPGGVSFLRFIDLPGGLPSGPGDYAHLIITARAEPASRPTPPVAIRQFDIQSSGTLIYGFGEGWHEAEYDNATGLSLALDQRPLGPPRLAAAGRRAPAAGRVAAEVFRRCADSKDQGRRPDRR